MIDFISKNISISYDNLHLKYRLIPWDSKLFGYGVMDISDISVDNTIRAVENYCTFDLLCEQEQVKLIGCRLPQSDIKNIQFLEGIGFNFIELSYKPELRSLQNMSITPSTIRVVDAEISDKEELADWSGKIFEYGRFHQDTNIDSRLSNSRYKNWLLNAFENESQSVIKCVDEKFATVAFFVVEYPEPTSCFISLVGMGPEYQGRGLAKFSWNAFLTKLQNDGFNTISTSISSHNIAVFNLYVSLGFRFPEPEVTLHKWRV